MFLEIRNEALMNILLVYACVYAKKEGVFDAPLGKYLRYRVHY